jgi:hypothetical protein
MSEIAGAKNGFQRGRFSRNRLVGKHDKLGIGKAVSDAM